MKRLVVGAVCGVIGVAVGLGGTTSRATAQQDDEGLSYDQRFLQLLGIRSGADINYQERSPLVLPPNLDLPKPQANATAATPNWPVDPDVKRKAQESNRRRDEVEEARTLLPSELNVGERKRSDMPGPTQDQQEGRPSKPSELGFFGIFGSKKKEEKGFTAEPPRTSLVEPPVGYQTPSPNQPYAAKPESWAPKIPTFFDFGTAAK